MHVAKNYWFNWFFSLRMFRHRFDVRINYHSMLRVFELNVKNPAFAKQKNSSNAKGFLWRTTTQRCLQKCKWNKMNNARPELVLYMVLNVEVSKHAILLNNDAEGLFLIYVWSFPKKPSKNVNLFKYVNKSTSQ